MSTLNGTMGKWVHGVQGVQKCNDAVVQGVQWYICTDTMLHSHKRYNRRTGYSGFEGYNGARGTIMQRI